MEGVSFVDHRDIDRIVHQVNNVVESCSKITYYDRKSKLEKLSNAKCLRHWAEIIEKLHTNY